MSFAYVPTTFKFSIHLRFDGVSVSFRDRRVLTAVSFVVPGDYGAGLIGENGSGKSTLLRIAAGVTRPDVGTVAVLGTGGTPPRIGLLHLIVADASPTTGHVDVAAPARVGLLTQEVQLAVPYGRGAGRTVQQTNVDLAGPDRAERSPLSTFGLITARDEHRNLNVLSLGQQRRLALAVLLADPPEVLLLDEPTNHLSLLLATELERAIPEYQGTIIVASHDRWLRKGWQGRHLELGAPAGARTQDQRIMSPVL